MTLWNKEILWLFKGLQMAWPSSIYDERVHPLPRGWRLRSRTGITSAGKRWLGCCADAGKVSRPEAGTRPMRCQVKTVG